MGSKESCSCSPMAVERLIPALPLAGPAPLVNTISAAMVVTGVQVLGPWATYAILLMQVLLGDFRLCIRPCCLLSVWGRRRQAYSWLFVPPVGSGFERSDIETVT